jgi:hypothetical protein
MPSASCYTIFGLFLPECHHWARIGDSTGYVLFLVAFICLTGAAIWYLCDQCLAQEDAKRLGIAPNDPRFKEARTELPERVFAQCGDWHDVERHLNRKRKLAKKQGEMRLYGLVRK